MDEVDQAVLVSCYRVAEAHIQVNLGADGYWSMHCRCRHSTWGWSEATVDHYERLTLPELMDVLDSMDPDREAR
jgi:hypothetical protein